MGIVIDNSGSMRDKRANVNAASLALVKASNPSDEVFIIGFNDNAYMDQEFTSDTKLLEAALDKTETRGGTAMRDAIHLALDYMKGLCTTCVAKGAKRDKKVILVITDGNDNTSDETLEQLVREARQSGVLIYAIGLLDEEVPGEARAAKRALKALAEASGGLDYYPKNLAEVEKITPEVAKEIRSQYLIAYTPLNPALDGTYRKIEVKLSGVKAAPRYRNGYYASADAQGVIPRRRIPPRRRRPRKLPLNRNNAWVSVAGGQRQSPAAVAQPVPALAHRDLLGLACRQHHAKPVSQLHVAASARTAAIPGAGPRRMRQQSIHT